MRASGEQAYPGESHRVRFLFVPPAGRANRLYVCFADAAPEPHFELVDELAPLGIARLHVLDDFGPYAGDAGYPGCWYLGEGRRLTFASDVAELVRHAAATLGLSGADVTAVGSGAGAFAALHLGLREGWGESMLGFPHTRLVRHLVGDLDEVASFVAGGTSPADRHWLDDLLPRAFAAAARSPRIDVLTGGLNYGRHVLPLLDSARAHQAEIAVHVIDAAQDGGVQAAFAGYLIERIAERENMPPMRVMAHDDVSRHVSDWSRRSAARLRRDEDGLRCFAPAVGQQKTGVYAGIRFDAGPFALARIELTLRRAHELDALLIDALDAEGRRVARWQWRFHEGAPRGRATLLIGRYALPPADVALSGDLADTAKLDVFVRIRPGRSADFTVHGIELFAAPDAPLPDPGLSLPAPVDAAAGVRRVRDHAAVARQVAALVADGTFPPPTALPVIEPRRPGLKVACLLDRFSELGFRYEFDYIDFTPEDWRETIDREAPDLLLVESIWRGKDESWNKLMVPDTSGRGPTDAVIELVRHCRARGIPTVFWNKEDPPNFEHFVRTATLFDFIFTTDESCVPRYRSVAGHDRIGVLPFAAQPAIHNPVGAPVERPLDVAFLGTFYGRKHAARKRQMEMILDPAREFGVHIYSRVEAAGGYAFPEKYVPHLIGTIPYEQVIGAYRSYKVLLNVNSVPDSKTMCARRVFEILGCGGAVLSGPSPALTAVLGAGVVHESSSYADSREILEHVLGNGAQRERIAVEGIRRVSRAHTYSHRVDDILRAVDIDAPSARRSVALVALVGNDTEARQAVEVASAQSRPPDELVLAGPVDALELAVHAEAAGQTGVTLRPLALEVPNDTAAVLLAAAEVCQSEVIGTFAPSRCVYGVNYLEDLLYAFDQSHADIVGKGAHYRQDSGRGWLTVERRDDEHRFVDELNPGALLVRRQSLARVPPGRGEELRAWQRRARAEGLSVYASDRFNFASSGTDARSSADGRQYIELFGPGAEHALA